MMARPFLMFAVSVAALGCFRSPELSIPGIVIIAAGVTAAIEWVLASVRESNREGKPRG